MTRDYCAECGRQIVGTPRNKYDLPFCNRVCIFDYDAWFGFATDFGIIYRNLEAIRKDTVEKKDFEIEKDYEFLSRRRFIAKGRKQNKLIVLLNQLDQEENSIGT